MNYIAKNIQYLRKKQRITRKDLAEKLGVKPRRLAAWLDVRCEPSINMLISIANLFNVTLQELVIEDLEWNDRDRAKITNRK